MLGKTHIAVGIPAAYLIMQPKTLTEFAVATIGGSIGGVMADIDVHINTENRFAAKASLDALYGEMLAVAISFSFIIADYFADGNLIDGIVKHVILSMIGAIMLAALIVVGKMSEHRDRTHSLLAWALFTASVVMIEPHLGLAFAIGYGSHLFIDLFNKSPIRLLYPLKKGICFKLCYADRLGNELLLIVGVVIIIFYTTNSLFSLSEIVANLFK